MSKVQTKTEKGGLRARIGAAALCLLVLLLMVVLAACSLPAGTKTTTLAADEYGKLTETIIEPREGGFTEEELRTYIEEDITAFNGEHGEDAIELETCSVKTDTVTIKLTYSSYETYSEYNQVHCFQGTLRGAANAGYDMEQTFYDENGAEANAQTLTERAGEWKVLIVEEPILVKVPDKILYVSDNVTITGRLAARVDTVLSEEHQEMEYSEYAHVSDRDAYIIYK